MNLLLSQSCYYLIIFELFLPRGKVTFKFRKYAFAECEIVCYLALKLKKIDFNL